MATGTSAQNVDSVAELLGSRALIGGVDKYIPGEDFDVFIERLENFFRMNGIRQDALKSQLFQDKLTAEAYKVLKGAIQPASVNDKPYSDLVGKLREKYAPKLSVVAECCKFYRRNQLPGESIRDYIIELQQLAETCAFGDFLQRALRDRLIMGMSSERIREKLVSADRDFDETVRLAMAAEATRASLDVVAGSETAAGVSFIKNRGKVHRRVQSPMGKIHKHKQKGQQGFTKRKRYPDGAKKRVQCYFCQQWGSHYAVNCPEKRKRRMNHAEEEDSEGDDQLPGTISSMFLNAVKKEKPLDVPTYEEVIEEELLKSEEGDDYLCMDIQEEDLLLEENINTSP
uniref:CCHC-type domain-containing protein n=1 Tax=Lutzomyia longipalpis TaxID=7200 RepID=A0A1B0GGX1_LUTLO